MGYAAAAILTFAAVLVVVGPWLIVGGKTVTALQGHPAEKWALARQAVSLQALVSTGVYAMGIGTLATVLAFPAGWVLARVNPSRRARHIPWVAVVASPLLLPSYLAYAGWGLLRGPNTRLGDWLAVQEPLVSVIVGRLTAILGMTLWVWPLAALVLAGSIRRSGADVPELAALDAPGAWSRLWVLARAIRSGIASAILLVALVITGSAIPLHVAQVPTYAIELWKVMQLSPDATGIWIASTPLLALAAISSWVIGRSVMATRPESEHSATAPSAGAHRPARLGTLGVWMLSVAVPLGLFAWSLGSWRSIPMFWRISGAGVLESLKIAVWTATGGLALLITTWAAIDLGGRVGRRVGAWGLGLFLFSGLVPGVLTGAAMNTATGWISPHAGVWIVVATHLARFGFVAVLGGWWLASIQPREHRWMRDLDGARSLGPWLAVTLRPHWAPVVGLGLAVAALSFHEIESTVLVLPPGLANLPQQLLDYLHYARDEQLSAAAVNLLSLGTLVALLAAGLTSAAGRQPGAPRTAAAE